MLTKPETRYLSENTLLEEENWTNDKRHVEGVGKPCCVKALQPRPDPSPLVRELISQDGSHPTNAGFSNSHVPKSLKLVKRGP